MNTVPGFLQTSYSLGLSKGNQFYPIQQPIHNSRVSVGSYPSNKTINRGKNQIFLHVLVYLKRFATWFGFLLKFYWVIQNVDSWNKFWWGFSVEAAKFNFNRFLLYVMLLYSSELPLVTDWSRSSKQSMNKSLPAILCNVLVPISL